MQIKHLKKNKIVRQAHWIQINLKNKICISSETKLNKKNVDGVSNFTKIYAELLSLLSWPKCPMFSSTHPK